MDELNFDSFAQFGAENPIQGVWSDELLCLPPSEDYTKNSDATCASLPEVDPSLEGVAPFNLPTIGDHGQASLYYPTLPPTSLVGFNISDAAATAQFATGAVSNTVMNPRDLEVEHSETDPFTLQTMPEMLLARQSQGFGLHAKHDGGWSSSGSCSGDTVPRLDSASRFSSSNGLTSDSEHILESARKRRNRHRKQTKNAGHARKRSLCSPAAAPANRITKNSRVNNAFSAADTGPSIGLPSVPMMCDTQSLFTENESRPFPCVLAMYGCEAAFLSKNEWKRHISTQHVRPGFWRCKLCAHSPPSTGSPVLDDEAVFHNDFSRKDLFTQHLRRMHLVAATSSSATPSPAIPPPAAYHATNPYGPSPAASGVIAPPVTEQTLTYHQEDCYVPLRDPPLRSACLFCSQGFAGPHSWEECIDHVGQHLERERKAGRRPVSARFWYQDLALREWLVAKGLLVKKLGCFGRYDADFRLYGVAVAEGSA